MLSYSTNSSYSRIPFSRRGGQPYPAQQRSPTASYSLPIFYSVFISGSSKVGKLLASPWASATSTSPPALTSARATSAWPCLTAQKSGVCREPRVVLFTSRLARPLRRAITTSRLRGERGQWHRERRAAGAVAAVAALAAEEKHERWPINLMGVGGWARVRVEGRGWNRESKADTATPVPNVHLPRRLSGRHHHHHHHNNHQQADNNNKNKGEQGRA